MRRIALTLSALFIASAFAASSGPKRTLLEPKEFDRLDGRGATAKKVDVIEWENNLEIHVYPKGGLKSLGMKIDRTNKEKPVMVIEYGFTGVPYTLIRRALLSIPMKDSFKTFQDTSTTDYDKIIVSNNTLTNVKTFALAPEPTQIYPDYHPALLEDAPPTLADSPSKDQPAKTYGNTGTSLTQPRIQLRSADEVEQDSHGTARRRVREPSNIDDEPSANSGFKFK